MTYALPAQFQRSAAHDYLAAIGWAGIDDKPEPVAELPPQVDTAYHLLRNGATEIEIKLAIQEQYGKGARPNLAFRNALELVIQEQRAAREHLPELVMSIRFNAIQRAINSGQLGAAAAMLRDVGAACGEAALDAAGATLTVQVLEPGSGAAGTLSEGPAEPSEPIQEPPPPPSRRRGAAAA